jgi:hypothetical protein
LSLPTPSNHNFTNGSDLGSAGIDVPSQHKFPHTRALLSSIARQHKPFDTYDGDPDGDDLGRVSPFLVSKVVGLLDEEQEDELKKLLKETYAMDDDTLEQSVLDLMHKHHDDVAGVPFLFLTPTRRPISRPSSRASSHSVRLNPTRPETPTSAPNSPLALGFRRPHTPVTSPLAGIAQPSSYMSARSVSPHSSPILAHVQATQAHAQFTASLPASPLSSPRLLNAKATEFKPIPRPLSATASNPASLVGLRAETPSPDLWSHNPLRPTSNLAIAAPLIPEQAFLPRAATPSSSLRSSLRPADEDDEEDPFDPFASKAKTVAPLSFHSITVSDFDTQWSNSSNSSRSPEDHRPLEGPLSYSAYDTEPLTSPESTAEIDQEAAAMLTDGMTPFDVLSSVFGSTLAPSELEDALATNGYDFERAMAWLVDRSLPPVPQNPQIRLQPVGGRVTIVSGVPNIRGGRSGYQSTSPPNPRSVSPRYTNGRAAPGGNRVCRYFIAGECLRADCRFR